MASKTVSKSKKTVKSEEFLAEVELVKYEVMLIIDPDLNQVDYAKRVEDVRALIVSHQGVIWHEQEWGKRELAYSIKRKSYGFYVIFNFEMDPSQAKELNQQLRILNFVLRYLLIKTPKDYVPQEYKLDEEPRESQIKEVKQVLEKTKIITPVQEQKLIEDEEEVADEDLDESSEEEPEEDIEIEEKKVDGEEVVPEKKEKSKDKVEIEDKESADKLNKLDKKLEELLSGEDNFNL
ncbi:MAG: 30S ribosomal protein S6, small subunit ribosomal protein S6 [Candidatus Peregrinibacteria bacterium GW2011_GWE2_39_6]|nr:MAG: 30S ribosomal protein S6, small subunit ribosomal protein S6 [Candidatus Peregrinibacteria bacterium GW2011_GWF2_39_17]KKR26412.1 MAG: 30S ribosomal protein S6, small subunit ribosomal protein S6 [Candidatus Peregrinibacteria bacterium GW2011_GWE2_39_6]HCW32163.1 30S ribosomal protein S6 [Candidatus Peregrinibacteria bacterium]